jgi:hypothetical protein
VFSVIGVREPQAAASEAFVKFAEAHRNMEKYGIQLLKTIKPVSSRRNEQTVKSIHKPLTGFICQHPNKLAFTPAYT